MMPVKKDPSGRRYVEAEVEVPGSPEQVWDAIATGAGVSSWFVPAEIEERIGGTAKLNFGPGMDSFATVTAWEPPHRFAADSRDDPAPGSPTIATEWIVESRGGGTCTVRVVHSWFADSDNWDKQFEGHEQGWVVFFRILRAYLTHFPGQHASMFHVMAMAPGDVTSVWRAFTEPLGLGAPTAGSTVTSAPDAPRFSAVVERVGTREHPELLLRLQQPVQGLAHLFAMPMGGTIVLPARFFLFGTGATEAAARMEPQWKAWMEQHFPAPAMP
jgi:uncharacterized protein YndB with AHSA1/START domain